MITITIKLSEDVDGGINVNISMPPCRASDREYQTWHEIGTALNDIMRRGGGVGFDCLDMGNARIRH